MTSLLTDKALEKESILVALLQEYGSIAIAYSGGVDSAYLADTAHEALGPQARLIIADSPSIPRSELDEARDLAAERQWNLDVLQTEEFEREDYLKNDGTRCYHCRVELFTKMRAYAAEAGVRYLAYGANSDDLLDPTRLGHQAAREFEVVAPLQEAELTKEEIRALSGRRGLPTADKASFACLASRVPKGTRVSLDALGQVERVEEALKAEGFHQYRARHHGDLVRIEVDPSELPRLFEEALRARVTAACIAAGYKHTAVDLAGYRTGSTA
jgi:uncharacterized protein